MHWRSLEERSVAAGERFDGIPSVVGPGYSQPMSVIGSDALRRSMRVRHGQCEA